MSDFGGMILPFESNHEEHHDDEHPKERNCPISVELSQTIDDEDLTP